ncbi:MAG: family 78 glycoside hydrolase catalytic domain [Blautia sp.]|nr:family 78 glycoside hydrolase catalytic domain [Blautia sp.]
MNKKRAEAVVLGMVMTIASIPTGVFAETEGLEPAIVNLKTEDMINPLGIDEARPAFSWQMQSEVIGAAQKSYEILVTDEAGTVVWDSGQVESSISHEILYEGEELKPVTEYSWKVTVTDNEGNSLKSETATLETYVRIELDISDVEGAGAKISACRVGYTAVDSADTPVFVIEEDEGLNELITSSNKNEAHQIAINVSGSTIVVSVDGEAVGDKSAINPLGDSSSYNSFPNLNSIGFASKLMVENYRAAMVTDFYTMKEGENIFAPDLTFHGYRYIEISGLGAELPAECIRMQVLSSLDATGTYESSNELTNQLYQNIVNSTTSNYISIPTDCPQRNERMGWTGDAQIFALTGSYVADTYNFLDVWMDSVRADCGETGMSAQFTPAFIQYAPEDEAIEHKGQSFGITWNSLVVTIPYNLYMQTGRKEILEENKENIYAYVDTLASTPLTYKNAEGEKLEEPGLTGEVGMLADHLARVVTDSTLLGNALYINCLNQAAEIADIMGDTDKAETYREISYTAKETWNKMFIDPQTGKTKNTKGEIQDTQASYATPLRFGAISDENMEKVLANYEASIAEASGEDTEGDAIVPYTLTTGFNATGNFLNALSDNGMNDTAYRLFEAVDYASWLYPVTQGATSIWERWNSYTEEKAFGGNNSMNSFNHYSFGAVGEWMMGYQLGIKADKDQPGYQYFILQPTVGETFTQVKGSYDSAYGTIASGWTAADGRMTSYDVTVPANTTATLYLPAEGEVTVCDGVTAVGMTEHNGIQTQQMELVAGTYHFEMNEGEITVCLLPVSDQNGV